jgi:hypothetical protein
VFKRGASPSLFNHPPLLQRREIPEESQREAKSLLYDQSSFPLSRGRRIKGDRVTNDRVNKKAAGHRAPTALALVSGQGNF